MHDDLFSASSDRQEQDRQASERPDLPERPWIPLGSSYDVDTWINNYDRDLRYHAGKADPEGVGIGFRLEHGGDVLLHTTADGEVLLQLTAEAEWVAPVVTAATGVQAPAGNAVWVLPPEVLVQLILGLSSLIATVRPVLDHPFRRQTKAWR